MKKKPTKICKPRKSKVDILILHSLFERPKVFDYADDLTEAVLTALENPQARCTTVDASVRWAGAGTSRMPFTYWVCYLWNGDPTMKDDEYTTQLQRAIRKVVEEDPFDSGEPLAP
jgi:hypothetical protein